MSFRLCGSIAGAPRRGSESVKILIYRIAILFTGGRGGDEGPAHERDYGSSACACANEYEVLWVDRSVGVYVGGVQS